MTTDETIQAIEALPNNDSHIAILTFEGNEIIDWDGVCSSGDLVDLADELKLYREFVGAMTFIETKPLYRIVSQRDGSFQAVDEDWNIIATGTDAFDAYCKMR